MSSLSKRLTPDQKRQDTLRQPALFCVSCARSYTPHPKVQGCPVELRQEAVRHSLKGLLRRKVACLLRVAPQSIANWLDQAGAVLCEESVPEVPYDLLKLADGIMEKDRELIETFQAMMWRRLIMAKAMA